MSVEDEVADVPKPRKARAPPLKLTIAFLEVCCQYLSVSENLKVKCRILSVPIGCADRRSFKENAGGRGLEKLAPMAFYETGGTTGRRWQEGPFLFAKKVYIFQVANTPSLFMSGGNTPPDIKHVFLSSNIRNMVRARFFVPSGMVYSSGSTVSL